MLTAALATAAFVAGVTGTWSPCGFSMIETIGRPRRFVLTASVTFAAGAVCGGIATFAALAALGGVLAGAVATVIAAVVVAAAIVADAQRRRIAPQVRRQVPESWRRVLPLPVATWLYGVLLGLGFTTYVLTFAVWGVAALAFATGDVVVGCAAGIAFGVGRALPIVVTAPLLYRPSGAAIMRALAERPQLLRGARLVDAAAVAIAAVFIFAGEAKAATNLGPGTDPSASGELFAWTTAPVGMLRVTATATAVAVPGRPAVGGALVAWRTESAVQVARAADLAPVLDLAVTASALAVNDTWLVTREPRQGGGDSLVARPLASPAEARVVASVPAPAQLGRPALDGDTLVFHTSTRRLSQIVAADLVAGTSTVVRTSRLAHLTNPSLLDGQLLFVRQTSTAQRLELGRLAPGSANRVLYRLGAPSARDRGYEPGHSHGTRTPRPVRAAGTLWTTALASATAYVTFVRRRDGVASIVSVPR